MKDSSIFAMGFWIGFGMGVLLIAMLSHLSMETIKSDAIQRGFAEYNQTNGVWQWKK